MDFALLSCPERQGYQENDESERERHHDDGFGPVRDQREQCKVPQKIPIRARGARPE